MEKMPILKKGSVIEIVAPSSGIPNQGMEETLLRAESFIKNLGFEVKMDKNIISYSQDPFSANSLEFRTNSLINALQNDESSAIWCIRGGYGACQILPMLDKISKPKSKLLLGFSDITALHLYFQKKWTIPSVHSKVLYQYACEDISDLNDEISLLKNIMTGSTKTLEYQITPLNDFAENAELTGSVIGGNMSIIQTSIGTNWQIDSKDKFIFFEEVNERGYRIDRMLYHFEQAGIFKEANAIIIGDISASKEEKNDNYAEIAVKRAINRINLPIFRLKDVGHERNNYPLPLGIETSIKNNILKFIL